MLSCTGPTLLIHHIRPTPVVAGQGSPFTGRPVDSAGFGGVRAVLLDSGSIDGGNLIRWGLFESGQPDGEFELIDDGDILCAGVSAVHGFGVLTMRIGPEVSRQRYLRVEVAVTGPGSVIFAVLLELYEPQRPRWFDGGSNARLTAFDGRCSV